MQKMLILIIGAVAAMGLVVLLISFLMRPAVPLPTTTPVITPTPEVKITPEPTVTQSAGKVINCLPEQRKADMCTADFAPVCAKVNIQCIKAPCNPIQETFSNACNACKNSLVESYVAGECK